MPDAAAIFDRLSASAGASPFPEVQQRLGWLRDLHRIVVELRPAIQQAVRDDFEKPEIEADVSEILPVLLECRTALRHLKSWTTPERVRSAFPLFGLSTKIAYRPKGVVLIISPWNYPFNLSLGPLVSALAAGNRILLKPSERVPHSSGLIADIVHRALPQDVAEVIEGGPETGEALLALPFDHFFFTGGERVGRLVARAAAEHLSTATLELGGKSPAVVDGTVGLEECAEKIIRGKYLNGGQTCIAPDYVVVRDPFFERFVDAAVEQAARFEQAADIAAPVDDRHARYLRDLEEDAIRAGATVRRPKVPHPHLAVITEVPLTSRLMREEVFGPILPVLRYRTNEELFAMLARNPTPLSTYVFSHNEEFVGRISREFPTGSLSINETLLHFLHPRIPFGGVGTSGLGRSHGRAGFETFSNPLPIMRQNFSRGVVPLFYPPGGRFRRLARKALFRILRPRPGR